MTTTPQPGSDPALRSVPVYILAGGKSRRFGSDKARAEHDGVPLVVGVARTLQPVATAVTVVAARDRQYQDLGLRTIGDVVPDKGPMGGVLTAIEDCGVGRWLFVAACDWVGARADWVRSLLSRAEGNAQAVVFVSDRYQSMFALYHTSIRELIAGEIRDGQLSLQKVFGKIVTVTVPVPAGWDRAVNLNRPLSDT